MPLSANSPLPLSPSLITWVLIGGVALTILRQFGIDIQPLLTVGGFSGVVLGFAAQVRTCLIHGNHMTRMPSAAVRTHNTSPPPT